jgi:hypothetical protein
MLVHHSTGAVMWSRASGLSKVVNQDHTFFLFFNANERTFIAEKEATSHIGKKDHTFVEHSSIA